MNCSRKLTDSLYWVGANDRRIALFENVYPVPGEYPITPICF